MIEWLMYKPGPIVSFFFMCVSKPSEILVAEERRKLVFYSLPMVNFTVEKNVLFGRY